MVVSLKNKERYPKVALHILSYMEERLPKHLTYHTLSHTIDVANVCDSYIQHYDIDRDNADLIRIAAVSHDVGYIISPKDHEESGILEVKPFLEKTLNHKQIESINGMVRATKVPQNPTTFYEEIIADADLDYLGRIDYDQLSEKLKLEFIHFKVIKNETEWLKVQIDFLESHSYHTSFAKETRSAQKLKTLEKLKVKL